MRPRRENDQTVVRSVRRRVNCDAASRNEPPSSAVISQFRLFRLHAPPPPRSGNLSAVTTGRPAGLAWPPARPAFWDLFGGTGCKDVADAARNSEMPACLVVSPPLWTGLARPAAAAAGSDRPNTGRLEIKRFLPRVSWCHAVVRCVVDVDGTFVSMAAAPS